MLFVALKPSVFNSLATNDRHVSIKHSRNRRAMVLSGEVYAKILLGIAGLNLKEKDKMRKANSENITLDSEQV